MLLETPICNFGWKAPDFELRDACDNHYTLEKCMGKKGLLLVFICNHCPYVKSMISRFVEDAKKLKEEGISIVAVMSNDYADYYEEDAPEHMLEFAKEHGFDFPYLIDGDQTLAKAYGAVCTPDFFGFNNKGELQYRGRIDDISIDDEPNHREPELLNAMLMVAKTGKGPEKQKPSMGCSIKWSEPEE